MKYLLKTKGTAKIPDYLQIRDEEFQLIEHCTVKKSAEVLLKQGINLNEDDLLDFINKMPFGKLTPIED